MATSSNLERLQIFREVVLAGSFSKAAAVLKQPKSRVSRHIAALEREMRTQLIYRTTRQFQLTQAGRELYQKAGPLIQELNQALEQIHSDSDEMSGLIRVTVPIDIGSELMGKFCFEFMRMYPKIQISVVVTNEFVDLVKDGIDVAIRAGKNKDSSLIQRKLNVVSTIPIVSADFASRFGAITKTEDLERIPHIAFSKFAVEKVKVKLIRGKDVRTLHFQSQLACNNFFMIRSLTLQGAGVSFLPAYLVKENIVRGELVHVLKDWTTEMVPINILIPQQKSTPKRIRKFVDFMAERLSQFL